MGKATVVVLQVVIALALAGSVVVQAMILPAIWRDLEGAATGPRVTLVTLLALVVVAMQVFGVCVWVLVTKVRKGSVFSESSFRWVDVIVWAFAASAVFVFALAVLMAPGGAAPGIVGLVCGAALVLAGIALLVVVMKSLLRQAIERDAEARALRSELDEVV
ncbi:DUF2975 domain-containing protein [Microbacterium sp. NPDC057407]|uniref:DUF2975 domain-containing protein n=1 Tax=Microbacterium sp. NPDC057407 TaxID=3346120 RepID=UPI00367324F5